MDVLVGLVNDFGVFWDGLSGEVCLGDDSGGEGVGR